MCLSNKKKKYILKYFLNNRFYLYLYSVNGGNFLMTHDMSKKAGFY